MQLPHPRRRLGVLRWTWRRALRPPPLALLGRIPVLIEFEELLSPEHHPDVCAVGALYLYNTRYIVDTNMDYDRLIPECMIGKNFWVVSNKRLALEITR